MEQQGCLYPSLSYSESFLAGALGQSATVLRELTVWGQADSRVT